MDLILLDKNFREKCILENLEVDMVIEPESEDAENSIKTVLDNPNGISLGDFIAVEGTDFGGEISKMKIDYSTDIIEFKGPSWWQFFSDIYVNKTSVKNKTLSQAIELLFQNSQFQFFEITAQSGSDIMISLDEPLGDIYSLSDSLKILQSISGKTIKFRYSNNILKVISCNSTVFEGINVNNTNSTIEVNSFIPDFFVLSGDTSKPQYEKQVPSGINSEGEEFYPRTVIYYDTESETVVQMPDKNKRIRIIVCDSNNSAGMVEKAKEKHEEILNAAYGVSGDFGEELTDAECGDSIEFNDEVFGINFNRKIERKILQKAVDGESEITVELGDISYL